LENLQKLGSDFYAEAQKAAEAAGAQAQGGEPGPDAGPSAGPSKSEPKKADVVDADFEVVEDDKKK
jgi:molecular chaperone DnaK